jgi:cardiolipin synthase
MESLLEPEIRKTEQAARAGVRPGINIAPGAQDDGWKSPPPVTLNDGSLIHLFKDGEALYAGYNAIKSAKFRICLEIYIFASDDTGRAFAELLSQKAREGVSVHVIYDSFGSIDTDRAMFDSMRAAGVRLIEFHPIAPWRGRSSWRPMNRDHRKVLIVDNQIAWMGGLNIGGEYAGSWVVQSHKSPCDFWRDSAIGIEGPTARLYLNAFAKTWSYLQRRKNFKACEFIHNLPFAALPEGADGQAPNELGLLASVPGVHAPLKPLLNRFVRNARRRLDITMSYFAPHDALIHELVRAARRGVKVRLMLPAKCDVNLLIIAARAFYETLLTAGVQIYERQYAILHSKTMVADELISVVGSSNLDYRSIEFNLELSTVIRSRQFALNMHALFENDMQFAKRITLNKWRHRPVYDRFVQWLVSRARYLL